MNPDLSGTQIHRQGGYESLVSKILAVDCGVIGRHNRRARIACWSFVAMSEIALTPDWGQRLLHAALCAFLATGKRLVFQSQSPNF